MYVQSPGGVCGSPGRVDLIRQLWLVLPRLPQSRQGRASRTNCPAAGQPLSGPPAFLLRAWESDPPPAPRTGSGTREGQSWAEAEGPTGAQGDSAALPPLRTGPGAPLPAPGAPASPAGRVEGTQGEPPGLGNPGFRKGPRRGPDKDVTDGNRGARPRQPGKVGFAGRDGELGQKPDRRKLALRSRPGDPGPWGSPAVAFPACLAASPTLPSPPLPPTHPHPQGQEL